MPDIEGLLPITPLSLALLLVLAEGEQHGYALMKEVERLSEGRLRPGTGTLYAALQRMVEEGWVELSVERRPEEDARRRYYGITTFGRSVARAELARLGRLVELGERRLAPLGSRQGARA